MQRRKFGREFKVEAVRLIKDRGVSVAQYAAGSLRERLVGAGGAT
jgi:transposase